MIMRRKQKLRRRMREVEGNLVTDFLKGRGRKYLKVEYLTTFILRGITHLNSQGKW